MINKEKTLVELGVDIDLLKPNSGKKVFWNCNGCDEEFIKGFRSATKHQLCLKCSNKINANTNIDNRNQKMKVWHTLNPHPLLGKPRPLHVIETLRKVDKSYTKTPEHREKMSQLMKGSNNGFFGKKHTEESLQKMRKSHSIIAKRGKDSNFYGKIYHGKGQWFICKNKRIFWMRSSWEVKFAIYLDENNIRWDYENKAFDLIIDEKEVSYTPDFYLIDDDKFIEVKGYWREDAKVKFKTFKETYPDINIKIYDKSKLKEIGIL